MPRNSQHHTGSAQPVSITGADGPQWQRCTEDLRRLRDLGEDWDGAGAARPIPEIIEAAIAWLRKVSALDSAACPPSAVTASPTGEVIFVWQENGTYLEAEIVSADRVEWMQSVPGQSVRHWNSGLDEAVPSPPEHITT